MAPKRRRKRLKILLDDGQALHAGCALRLDTSSHDSARLLVDCEVQLSTGQAIDVYPLPDDPDVALLDMAAAVISSHQDVLVPADADYRFMAVLSLSLTAPQRIALQTLVEAGDVVPSRFRRRTHDDGLLAATIQQG